MASRSLLALSALTSAWFVAVPARAHVSLNSPKSRYFQTSSMQADQSKLKKGPCGAMGDTRTTNSALITTYKPGQKLMVTWKETVQHPGHFEISFDSDGQDFPAPGTAPSSTSGVTVLAANIADKSSSDYTYEVTLPNMECSNCTLQLVQVMTTSAPPYGDGDLYFNCADIVIKGDGAGGGSTGGAGGASTGGVGGKNNGGSAGTTPGGTGNAGSGIAGNAGAGQGIAGSGVGGANTAGTSGAGPAAGMTGAAGMPIGGAGGASNTGFGGLAGASSAGATSTGGTTSVPTTGGVTGSGGALATSGGTPSTSGGAPSGSSGSPTGMSGAGTTPPNGGFPEEPGGCSLVRPSNASAFGWLAAAAGALAVAARRRKNRTR